MSDGRGDVVGQTDQTANLTWTASYEAFGKRTEETGTNLDPQRSNSKDEGPMGLVDEGIRWRDTETGGFLSRDPAGFVDGPNAVSYTHLDVYKRQTINCPGPHEASLSAILIMAKTLVKVGR